MNEKGATLIELLLSFLLLTIVLISFSLFFSQSILFNNKNEGKQRTANTAQTIVNLIQERVDFQDLIHAEIINADHKVISPDSSGLVLDDQLRIENLIQEKLINPHTSELRFRNGHDNLIEVKVIVTDPNNNENTSETFTYIRR